MRLNFSIFKEYDEKYNSTLPKVHAVRVEQGEYIVVPLNVKIGTYNVNQCVVVYIKDNEMHGLAHIDGHTEISSLRKFIDKFNNPQITIFRDSSSSATGLDDPNFNFIKVSRTIESFNFKYQVFDKKFSDYVIDSEILDRIEGLPIGITED